MRARSPGCGRPARSSSAAPTWSSSPSAGWASIRTTARRETHTNARSAGCQAARPPAPPCGVTGWKPTARRVPREGAFPLSFTLDSVGPIANSVACCAAYDAILAGEPDGPLAPLQAKGLRLLLPRSSALDDLDKDVARAFDSALSRLSRAGAAIGERPVPQFDRQGDYFKGGGYAGAE